jgi:uroporphyrinogen-III synthase
VTVPKAEGQRVTVPKAEGQRVTVSRVNSARLAGIKVVVCRPVDQAASLVERLTAHGGQVVLVPLVEVARPDDDGRDLVEALRDLAAVDWIVFTSANGVRAVVHHLGDLADLCQSVSVAAVGKATAAAVADAEGAVDFVSPVATAAALADSLPVNAGTRILAPLGQLAGTDLADGLRLRGCEVRVVEAYRMHPAKAPGAELLAEVQRADAVLFTAPSLVDCFADLSISPPPCVVSIGPRTAQRVCDQGWQNAAVADPHSEDGLITALINSIEA